LGICLIACFTAAAIGAIASVSAPQFYAGLARPSWAPPAALFGPVWSMLYALMAVAAWLAWHAGPQPLRARAMVLFAAQLALNALWSWLFFAWHSGAAALLDIALLCALIAATAACFWRLRPLAAALLLPYLAWVGFAAALNLALWRMNPQLL